MPRELPPTAKHYRRKDPAVRAYRVTELTKLDGPNGAVMHAQPGPALGELGDYVVELADGRLVPMRPEKFEALYEEA